MRQLFILFFSLTLLTLTACQESQDPETAVIPTPPIINTAVPSTNTPLPAPIISSNAADPASAPTQSVATDMPAIEPSPTVTATATATAVPSNPVSSITLEPIITRGLTQPLFVTHAFDERLFIVEQAGTIRIFQDGVLLETPFLDISNPVGSESNEQGLLGLAFHPNYPQNGFFFVNYTNNDGHTTIARYRVSGDANVAEPDSEQILLTISQPFANHNGGMVTFGPDGHLYVGMGDGGDQADPQGNGQNQTTLLGSILRLDVDSEDGRYTIPADNPFVADPNLRPEVWAYGLRNPWRFSFDRLNGDLFIADVGQNMWEEVSWQAGGTPGGKNFGWNSMEGNHCFTENCNPANFTPAIFEYDHNFGCSISGGYIYRGEQFLSLNGNYFTADFCNGTVWGVYQQPDGSWQSTVVLQSGLPITSFGEDVNGELYVVARTGRILQIRP
ncbi:MAG: glucose dehydrogenase [Chloroflexi bacterium]|nr:glucose dehydrogenase [Chloroflexota bacterium]